MSSKTPLVSIITPAFNAEDVLREAVASAQAQTFDNWEMIIVNDGSHDNTMSVAMELSQGDNRIIALEQRRSGPAQARNLALSHARGRFICFLDCDDLWCAQKLEIQLNLMIQNEWALSFTQYRRFTDDPEKTGRIVDVPPSVSYRQLLCHNVIPMLTVMLDTHKTGVVKFENAGAEDFILWLSLLKKGLTGYGIKQDLARYRVTKGSLSGNKIRAATWVWSLYRNVEGFSLATSLLLFAKYVFATSTKHLRF